LLASAVIDDILAILLLTVVVVALGPDQQASVTGLIGILARLVVYLAGALVIAWFVLPRLFNWIYQHRYLTQGTVSLALLAMLVFGWMAESLGGITAITGAFIAGVGLSRIREKPHLEIETAVYYVSYSLLVPIFFVNVGLHTDIGKITVNLVPFVLGLLAVAVVSKVVGSGLGALAGGFTAQESLRVGICRISRGEVGLIVASLGLANGLLSARLFQPVFLVIFLTTILTPPLVRWAFRGYAADTGETVRV
jgi:Kef-type K+ transport system membrane component KefB